MKKFSLYRLALFQVGCNLEELEEEGSRDRGFVMSDHADWLGYAGNQVAGAENNVTMVHVFSRLK